MASLITMCNLALSEIAGGQIASLTENSLESRECTRFASGLLEEMAQWFEWGDLRKRVVLAPITNDRVEEWGFAYAPPADMVSPLYVRQGPYVAPVLKPNLLTTEGGLSILTEDGKGILI